MDETKLMAAATLIDLRTNKRESVVVHEEDVCHAVLETAHGDAGFLENPKRLHVAGNVGRSSLEKLRRTPVRTSWHSLWRTGQSR